MDMPPPQISIIGSGISGLVLGRCLKHRGISNVIYEKDAARAGLARYGYGISLQSAAYTSLLKYLNVDEQTFRQKLAVDCVVGGVGKVSTAAGASTEFRANRQRLETLLREGLDVRWEHQLSDIRSAGPSHTLSFQDGQEAEASLIVDAEGPHSRVRKYISPSTDFKILPYAVYNGKRRISLQNFQTNYAPGMDGATAVQRKAGSVLLSVSINDLADNEVSISYTYSRPQRQHDPIFNPNRPNSGAKDIPEALFEEVATLQNLTAPFKAAFDAEEMRKDRLLNWLMRTVIVPAGDLSAAATNGIVLMGDAVHATPILGGNGANAAIKDGIELAELIAAQGTSDLAKFYEQLHDTWQREVEESETRLAQMHGEAKKANL